MSIGQMPIGQMPIGQMLIGQETWNQVESLKVSHFIGELQAIYKILD